MQIPRVLCMPLSFMSSKKAFRSYRKIFKCALAIWLSSFTLARDPRCALHRWSYELVYIYLDNMTHNKLLRCIHNILVWPLAGKSFLLHCWVQKKRRCSRWSSTFVPQIVVRCFAKFPQLKTSSHEKKGQINLATQLLITFNHSFWPRLLMIGGVTRQGG